MKTFTLIILSLSCSASFGALTPKRNPISMTTMSIEGGSEKPSQLKTTAAWTWRKEQKQSAIAVRYTLELPKDFKATKVSFDSPDQGLIVLSKDKLKVQGLFVNSETRFKVETQSGTKEFMARVNPTDFPLFVDITCRDFGFDFDKLKPKGKSSFFAGAVCVKENDVIKLTFSTSKDADWQGSSLFEHDGKGERWKVFKVDVDAAASSSSNNVLGNMLWGPQDQTIEYRILIYPKGGGSSSGARELLNSEVALALINYSLERIDNRSASVSGLAVPVSAYLAPFRSRIGIVVRWLGLVMASPSDSQNNVSQWSLGASYEFGTTTLIIPSIEFQSVNFGSKELALSTSFQGPTVRLRTVLSLFNMGKTQLTLGYTTGSDQGSTASLLEGVLKQNISFGKTVVSAGLRYQQQQLNTTTSKVAGKLMAFEVGTEF